MDAGALLNALWPGHDQFPDMFRRQRHVRPRHAARLGWRVQSGGVSCVRMHEKVYPLWYWHYNRCYQLLW